jgi:hypothetical protein
LTFGLKMRLWASICPYRCKFIDMAISIPKDVDVSL